MVRADGPPTTEAYRRPLTARVLPHQLTHPREGPPSSRHIGSPAYCRCAGRSFHFSRAFRREQRSVSSCSRAARLSRYRLTPKIRPPSTTNVQILQSAICTNGPFISGRQGRLGRTTPYAWPLLVVDQSFANRSVVGPRTSSRFVTACSRLWAHFLGRTGSRCVPQPERRDSRRESNHTPPDRKDQVWRSTEELRLVPRAPTAQRRGAFCQFASVLPCDAELWRRQ